MKDLSIVIVNWNSWNEAIACIQSVQKTVRNVQYEIILIDNNSRDKRSKELQNVCGNANLKIEINSENIGFGRACNQGVRQSKSEYILFLNPDTIVHENAIDSAVLYMKENPQAGILGCRLLNTDGTLQRWTAGAFPSIKSAFNHYFFLSLVFPALDFFRGLVMTRDVKEPKEVDWICGAFMLGRRKAIDEAGLFNEGFFLYGEDVDLCYEVKQKNWKIVYFPRSEVTHLSGKSVEQLSESKFVKGLLGFSVFYKARHGKIPLFIFNLITSAGYFLRSILYGLSGCLLLQKQTLSKAYSSWMFFRAGLAILFSFQHPAIEKGISS